MAQTHENPAAAEGNFKKITMSEVRNFIKGEITWAQLQGIGGRELYGIAEIGYRSLEEGKYEEAEKIFTGLSVMNPYDAYFHGVLGSIFARQSRYDEAVKEYSVSLDLSDSDPQIFVNRGEIYLQQGRIEEAYSDFRKAIAADRLGNMPSTGRAKVLVSATNELIQKEIENRKKELEKD